MKLALNIAFCMLGCALFAQVCRARVITVDSAGAGDFLTLQPALDAAADGDTVLVAPGVYVVAAPVDFNRLHDESDPLSPAVRDLVVRADGGPVTIRLVPPSEGEALALPVVVFRGGERRASVLDGFVLTGGTGGGVACASSSSPTIVDCDITENAGSAVECSGTAAPELTGCRLSENRTPVVRFGIRPGGAVACYQASSPSLSRCLIERNHALWGGGVYCASGAGVELARCQIRENFAAGAGGGIYLAGGATAEIFHCELVGNSTPTAGGGGYCGPASTAAITGCLVVGNWAVEEGGGLYSTDAAPHLRHCTIADNAAGFGGGGVIGVGSLRPSLVGSVVWGNHSLRGELGFAASHSLVEAAAVWPGEGNVVGDPRFLARGERDNAGTPTEPADDRWSGGDYRVGVGSPLLDSAPLGSAPGIDLDGNAVPCGERADIGAYERCTERFVRGEANADGNVDLSDALAILGFLFSGVAGVPCLDAADVEDDGSVSIADAILLLGYLFSGGSSPADPFGACGVDATADELSCAAYLPCS